MLIAHFSDPHILFLRNSLGGMRNFKQALGLANWVFRRRQVHRRARMDAVISHLLEVKPEAVVITGDLCQLAIPADYARFGRMLEPLHSAGIPVILLRGNHDHYSPGIAAQLAFNKLRERFALGCINAHGVARIGGVEFVPVDAAVPTPSFHCWGRIDAGQLSLLRGHLAKSSCGVRVAFGHFPLLRADGTPLPERMALREAAQVLELLRAHEVRAYLCGHIHKPFHVLLPGDIPQYCAGTITGGGVLRLLRINGGGVREEACRSFA